MLENRVTFYLKTHFKLLLIIIEANSIQVIPRYWTKTTDIYYTITSVNVYIVQRRVLAPTRFSTVLALK